MKDLLKHSAVAAAWLALWQILYLTLGRAIILPSPLSVARRVVAELYEVFDIRSLEEAQQHFEESPY